MIDVLQFMASTEFGGAEKVFVELTNILADQVRVTAVVVRGTKYLRRFASSVPVIELKSNPTRHNPLLWLELRRLLKQRAPGIIHTHAAKAAELVALVNRDRRFLHVATKHNDRKGSVFNRLPYISTVSEKARASVHLQPGGKIWVIYNGVNVEKVEPGHVTGSAPEKFTILAIGRLDAFKGFDQLIKAVAGLDFPFRLRIVGEGSERPRLEEEIAALGLQDKVFLEGFRDDVPQMMADSHLVVISSRREGGPRVLPEGLFYAPALISTPVGMVPEILPPELQSSLKGLGEKIADVHRRYSHYQRLFAEIANQRKNDFCLPVIAGKYLALYEEILTLSGRKKAAAGEKKP